MITLILLSILSFAEVRANELMVADLISQWEIDTFDVRTGDYKPYFPMTPDGRNHVTDKSHCSLNEWIDVLTQSHIEQQNWIDKCKSELFSTADSPGISPLILYLRHESYFSENDQIQNVKLKLEDGTVIRGFLALKKDPSPRPLIVFQCGIFCSAAQGPLFSQVMAHFFEESPFNVLALGSTSGPMFIKENGVVAIGGFEEGRILYLLSRLLKEKWEHRHLISSLHIVGASLGGNGALMSSVYASFNRYDHINSVLAYCPVVSLEKSIDGLYSNTLVGKGAVALTFYYLGKLIEEIPFLAFLRDLPKDPEQIEVRDAIIKSNVDSYKARTENKPWDLAPFSGYKITSEQDLWKVTDYTQFVRDNKIPTKIVHSLNDPIVRSRNNSLLIDQSENAQLEVLQLYRGNHCAFDFANGWANISALYREWILKNDPAFKSQVRSIKIDLYDIKKSLSIKAREVIFDHYWSYNSKKDETQLVVQIYNKSKSLCYDFDPKTYREQSAQKYANCRRMVRYRFSTEQLLSQLGVQNRPKQFENMWTKFLNSRVLVKGSNERTVLGSQNLPTHAELKYWPGDFE